MIRRITLHHWRAYESLDLPITGGVTFFVAPNGAGKLRLVEAVRWGLLDGQVTALRGAPCEPATSRPPWSCFWNSPGRAPSA